VHGCVEMNLERLAIPRSDEYYSGGGSLVPSNVEGEKSPRTVHDHHHGAKRADPDLRPDADHPQAIAGIASGMPTSGCGTGVAAWAAIG
jgi:hypothetical protein